MNIFEKPGSDAVENRTEIIKNAVANSQAAIENECSRTTNTWLECFGSRIFNIECDLDSRVFGSEVGLDKQKQCLERVEEIKERLYDLKNEYPDKTQVVPDDIKTELLGMLDNLLI